MKKIIVLLTILISGIGFQANATAPSNQQVEISIMLHGNGKETKMDFKFDTAADSQQFVTNNLKEVLENIENLCEVTVTITVTVTTTVGGDVGIASSSTTTSSSASATITASCDEISDMVDQIHDALVASLK